LPASTPSTTATGVSPGAPTATPTVAPATARARETCQKAIVKGSQTFVAKRLKRLDRCANGILTCIQTIADAAKRTKCIAAAGAKCTSTLDAVAADERVFRDRVVSACGAPLAATDLVAAGGLGYGTLAATCGTALDTPAALADCVVTREACEVDRLFGAEAPRAAELMDLAGVAADRQAVLACLPGSGGTGADVDLEGTAGKALAKCGKTVTKTATTFVRAELGAFARCALRSFPCTQSKQNDPTCAAKADRACAKALAAIAARRSAVAPAVRKTCGDPPLAYDLLRAPTGANLDALGTECSAAGVTELGTLAAYESCLVQQHACRIATLVGLAVPRLAELVGTPPFPFPPAPCP
jgi:hypothetical protein